VGERTLSPLPVENSEMTNKIDDPAGCPLAEAIECTADPELWRALKEGEQLFGSAAVRTRGTRYIGPPDGPRIPTMDLATAIVRKGPGSRHLSAENKVIASKAIDAWTKIQNLFLEKLNKDLRLTGCFDSPVAARTEIKAETLAHLDLFSRCGESVATGRSGLNLIIYNVRVFRGPAPAPAAAAERRRRPSPKAVELVSVLKKFGYLDATNNPSDEAIAQEIKGCLKLRKVENADEVKSLARAVARALRPGGTKTRIK
jgi:hypothetical protein